MVIDPNRTRMRQSHGTKPYTEARWWEHSSSELPRPSDDKPWAEPITRVDRDYLSTQKSQITRDSVGYPHRDNDFMSDITYATTPVFSYDWQTPWGQADNSPFDTTWRRTRIVDSIFKRNDHYGYLAERDLDNERVIFATEAAAGVNPSKADFDAAVFLGELRDLPSLFKHAGENMRTRLGAGGTYAAGEYLKFQYGWKPFVQDLRKFWSVVDKLDKRMRTIGRLEKGDPLRLPFRTKNPQKTVDYREWTDPYGSAPFADGGRLGLGYATSCTTERWGIVTFKPDIPKNLVNLPERSEIDKAMKALYGGVVDGNTLWQLMPWSWLADWNTNMSEFLQAQRNVVGTKVEHVLVMERMTLLTTSNLTIEKWPDYGALQWNISNGSTYSVIKNRITDVRPAAVVTGEISLLGQDDFRVSILGALGIQRLRVKASL